MKKDRQPRMYGIPSVVNMSKFKIMEAYQAPPCLFIGIEGYGRISKRAEPEDVRAWRADEISKEELIAKYFSREIEVALARRLNRLKGTRLTAEVKKIENTMFFRLPSAIHIQCPPNTPVGSASSENPMFVTAAVKSSSTNLLTKAITSTSISYSKCDNSHNHILTY